MAPSARSSNTGLDMDGDESDYGIQKADRKVQRGCGWAAATHLTERCRTITLSLGFCRLLRVNCDLVAGSETSGGEKEASAHQ